MTGGITSLPRLRRNLAAIWLLLAVENWSRYLLWYAGANLSMKLSLGAYALSQAVTWWLLSWVIFFMIDFTAGKRRLVALPFAAFIVLTCTLLSIYERSFLLTTIGPHRHSTQQSELEALLRTDFYLTLMWVVAIVALGRGLQWWHVEKTAPERHARLEAEKARAELSALAAQLEPHFLFNTLSGISTLAARNPAAAREMLDGLDDLLTYTTRTNAAVTLDEEMHFASRYLQLQAVRFAERLEVEVDVESSSLQCVVPQLILQPVLENAIRHGIEQLENGGRISIGSKLHDGRLLLSVRNTDAGDDARSSAGHGIGLACVRARLDLLYGGRQTFAIERDADTQSVTVRMSMPELRAAS
ncbi:MAG: histidine kinase [Acidobacteria bacterium]|nr:histidine kinase [Acidobacteriota bacterium]